MLSDSNFEKFRSLIIDHYENPRNFSKEAISGTNVISSSVTSCSDDFNILIDISKDIIKSVKFSGSGCVISTSATSILLSKITNQKIEDAEKIVSNFIDVAYGRNNSFYYFQEFEAYSNIHKKPNRIRCASVSANAIIEWLRGKKNA